MSAANKHIQRTDTIQRLPAHTLDRTTCAVRAYTRLILTKFFVRAMFNKPY